MGRLVMTSELREIRRLARLGHHMADIAARIGRPYGTVRYQINKYAIPYVPQPCRVTRLPVAQIVALHACAKMNASEIARRTGFPHRTVLDVLTKAGVTLKRGPRRTYETEQQKRAVRKAMQRIRRARLKEAA